ncbi:MAG: hypothetical protein KY476_03200 [Planctomycetes bacterium]|nr:hypothetical protein [Planctomycetota bacterium]
MRTPLIGIAVFGLLLHHQSQATDADRSATPFELNITPCEKSVAACAPVCLLVELRNVSRVQQTISMPINPRLGNVQYDITGPDGGAQRWAPGAIIDVGGLPVYTLDRGQSLYHRQLLMYTDGYGFHFCQPGRYRIAAALRLPFGDKTHVKLESNEAVVEVKPATGDDVPAKDRFDDRPQGRFAMGGGTSIEVFLEFDSIVKEQPKSSYAPWARFFLGRSWQVLADRDWQGRAMFDLSRYNKNFSQKAIDQYEAILENHPRFPLAVEVQYEIARELLRLGRREEALKRIEELLKQHPDLYLLRGAKRTIEIHREASPEGKWGLAPYDL